MHPERPTVVRLITRRIYPYLDYGVYEAFRNVSPEVEAAASKLDDAGIYLIGHLLQTTEERLREFSFMTDPVIDAMKRHLQKIESGFNMSAPRWNRSRLATPFVH